MRIRIIDAFTDRPFAGNPAAVCLLDADAWPDEAWMQQVAAEMNLSETAFAHPLADERRRRLGAALVHARGRDNLCGHATLATAHAMHRDRGTPGTVRFMSRSGVLVAHTADDGTITLDFPAAPLSEAPAPEGLAEALGATPRRTYATGALGDLLVVLADEAAVRGARPRPRRHRPHRPPRRHPRHHRHRQRRRARTPATTSSRASSPPPTASPRTRSPAAPTPRSRRSGRSASAATG